MRGHDCAIDYKYKSCDKSLPKWSSSPYLPNNKFMVNYNRLAYGYFRSGVLFSQYERFSRLAGIGRMTDFYMGNNSEDSYNQAVRKRNLSCSDALLEEVAHSVCAAEGSEYDGIDIVSDARHGWRKNSRFTDVVCMYR